MSETPEEIELPPVDGVEVFGPPEQPIVDNPEAAEVRP